MSEIDPTEKFPDLIPCKKAPTLHLLNGCGLTLYGQRDHDEETGTYVKTHYFCLLFIPIVSLGAYRVANAPGEGWYFIGRERLSGLAKLWNYLLIGGGCTAIGMLLVDKVFNSPDAVAGRKLKQAQSQFESGEAAEAVALWYEVAAGDTNLGGTARLQIYQAWYRAVTDGQAERAAAVFPVALRMIDEQLWKGTPQEFYKQGMSLAALQVDAKSPAAAETLDALKKLAPDDETYNADRRTLLERLVEQFPDDPKPAEALATVFEADDDLDRCEQLLTPHVDRLEAGEGARILGLILVSKGQVERATKLLLPYVTERLESLKQSEARYNALIDEVQQKAVKNLELGLGPRVFHRKYDAAATDEERHTILVDYLTSKVEEDSRVPLARRQLEDDARVVPVTLQLGTLMLQRAQEMADPEARQQELKQAEKMFLALAGVAGESDQYRLYMGQVKYWLGEPDAGRTLFDELLTANNRSCETLLAVSNTLRDVGAVADARELAEEAYESAPSEELRHASAGLRAILMVDLDDQIKWFERSDLNDLEAKASLATAKGRKAAQEGRDSEAERLFREAIALYETGPEAASHLNNGALADFALFGVTGDPADFARGTTKMEKAVSLQPSNSVLLINTATVLQQAAVLDLVGDRLDLATLKLSPSIEMLGYLYNDQQGRQKVIRQFVDHPRTQKALEYSKQVMLLAPKNPTGPVLSLAIYGYAGDLDKLRELARRLDDVEFDLSSLKTAADRYRSGEKDEMHRRQADVAADRLREALGTIDKTADPLTYAVGSGQLVGLQLQAVPVGVKVDADELVQLAESAWAAKASESTHNVLVGALLFRASQRLAKQHDEYAQWVDSTQRSLSHRSLMAIAAWTGGPLGEAALADPDVLRVVSLIVDAGERFPDYRGVLEWALLRHADPAETERVATSVRKNKADQLTRSLASRFYLSNADKAFGLCWQRQILGEDDEKAFEPLRECKANGGQLPEVFQ